MEKAQYLIIGFGKGGKTLAAKFANLGQSVILFEENPLRYGGTCINVACIPTKALVESAKESARLGGSFLQKAARYAEAIEKKGF
jgi:probable pyridine nucleotide-disulfide oxidoreductase